MRLGYHATDRVYVFDCSYDERLIAKAAHFKWNPTAKRWESRWARHAQLLIEYADDETKRRLQDAGHRREAADAKRHKDDEGRVPYLARNATKGTRF